ncbi:hypothetical protein L6452_32780 [Arctium lappa]|uniref:Uncharacterized protein n=1 Tax=Arctium lappa TaxID=4217 RepID=A0ACB8Z6N1_ARCLA|nr:hypothetical protein L6452_32780 [Arctium lappa]
MYTCRSDLYAERWFGLVVDTQTRGAPFIYKGRSHNRTRQRLTFHIKNATWKVKPSWVCTVDLEDLRTAGLRYLHVILLRASRLMVDRASELGTSVMILV